MTLVRNRPCPMVPSVMPCLSWQTSGWRARAWITTLSSWAFCAATWRIPVRGAKTGVRLRVNVHHVLRGRSPHGDWSALPQTGEFVPADAEDYEGDELNDLSDTGNPFHIRSHTKECTADTHNAGVFIPPSRIGGGHAASCHKWQLPHPKVSATPTRVPSTKPVRSWLCLSTGRQHKRIPHWLLALPANPTEPRYSKCQP